jgi:hypothetical protein
MNIEVMKHEFIGLNYRADTTKGRERNVSTTTTNSHEGCQGATPSINR